MTDEKRRTPAETWDAIAHAAEEEERAAEAEMKRILALPEDALDRELLAMGLDPAAIGAEGEARAERLLARRKAEMPVVATIDRERARRVQIRARRGKLSRGELEARIARAKTDPRLPAPLAVQFRNRGTEKATDEELEDLLTDLEAALEKDFEGE